MHKEKTNPVKKIDEKSRPFTEEQNQLASEHMKNKTKQNTSPHW